jgi:glutathione-regulated potassium-efflux system protein KefB
MAAILCQQDLDLSVVASEWQLLLTLLIVFTIAKGIVVYSIARLFGRARRPALRRTSSFCKGGEFAFVLYAAAVSGGVIDGKQKVVFSTVVILSMALTPLILIGADRLLKREASLEDVDVAQNLKGRILMIGFGRFGADCFAVPLVQRYRSTCHRQ